MTRPVFSEFGCSCLIDRAAIMQLFEQDLTNEPALVQKLNYFTRKVHLLNPWAYCSKTDYIT
ncbi:MAG: hypothetical protein WD183_07655 [Nitrosopumilaceae archaeon]